MSHRKPLVAAIVCVVVMLFPGQWGTPRCAGVPPRLVTLDVTILWGTTKGEEAINGGNVDKNIIKAVQQKLKLKQLEVLDSVSLDGESWLTWYAKVGRNNEKFKDMGLTLAARYWGTTNDSTRFGVSLESGNNTLFKRNLVLTHNTPQVEAEMFKDGYFIFVFKAKPW